MTSQCPYPCDNKTNMGYCQTTACINPQFSNIGTAYYGQGVQKRVITNADRIRDMTDETLAQFLCTVRRRGTCLTRPEGKNCPVGGCVECWMEWLRSDADG